MRSVVCAELGPPEKLVVEEREAPAAGPGSVGVAVRACGLNFVDALMIQGLYQIRPEPPFVPGTEIAGVIESLGEGVDGFSVGDAVMGMSGFGGWSERTAAPAGNLYRLPEKLGFERAAGFIQSYCTGLFALRNRAELETGETVLVLGAAGGVGLAAIDLAKSMGARVIAAASSEAKRKACLEQGADAVIDYENEDLKTRAKELSGGGVAVVYDPVGGDYAEPALRSLAPGGRHLVIGFAAGEIPRVPLNLVLLKQCQVVGVNWGGWSSHHPDGNRELLSTLIQLFEAGKINPLPPRSWPFLEAAPALRELMDRRIVGKGVLVPG